MAEFFINVDVVVAVDVVIADDGAVNSFLELMIFVVAWLMFKITQKINRVQCSHLKTMK